MTEDFLLMTELARLNEDYLAMANKLDMFYQVGFAGDELNKLEADCWVTRRDAYRLLVKIRDLGGDEFFIRRKAFNFGWQLGQIDSMRVREWLCKDAANSSDPNPVEAEHVYVQMAKNFPPEAIDWVKRAHWTGPVNVPWDRIDVDDKDKWAASHQQAKVKEFEKLIKAHDNHVAPSVIVQEEKSPKAFIVDGHHRALAHQNLKQDVLAYLGNIHPEDREKALETHTHQIHQGSDPENKQE
jgi:hypothetical protein